MLELFNMEGEIILKSRYKDSMTLKKLKKKSHLPHGMYFVRIYHNDHIQSTKIYVS
jgi:hypothetical protein